jgi:hypothetical protein
METTPVASGVMQHFVAQTPEPLQEGQIVEGIVVPAYTSMSSPTGPVSSMVVNT